MAKFGLLPYQTAWVRDAAPVKVIEKSRRIGLSWAEAYDSVLYAGRGNGNIYYQSYSHLMTKGFITDCADWARHLQIGAEAAGETLLDIDGDKIQAYRIPLASGKEIVAMTSSPRGFRSKGRPGDRAIVDEAAFIDDMAEVLKAALAFGIWGGRVRILSTHNGADSPFAELVGDIRAGRKPYSLHRVTLDDAIDAGLARRIFEVTGRDWSAAAESAWRDEQIAVYDTREDAFEELFCVPKKSGGVYFSTRVVEDRMVEAPILRFSGSEDFNRLPETARRADMDDWLRTELRPLLHTLDAGERHVYGMDFGRVSDLSVIAPLAIREDLRRRCPFMVELQNVPHAQQFQTLAFICERLPRFSGGANDARGNGEYLAEAAADKWGSMIDKVMISESWYRERMPRYRRLVDDGEIEIPRSDDLLQDHRAVKLVRGVPRLPEGKTNAARDRHGDGVIALVLAAQAADANHGPFSAEYVPHSAAGAWRGQIGDYVGSSGGPGWMDWR